MKINLLFILIACVFALPMYAQEQNCTLQNSIEKAKPFDSQRNTYAELLPSKTDISKENIAPLLLKNNYLGFIGNDKKRLKINFHSAEKMKNNHSYQVKGNTIVGNNNIDFQGIITIKMAYSFSFYSFGVDDEFKGKVKDQGIIVFGYEFVEDEKLKASGIFRGEGVIRWYVNDKNEFLYDNIDYFSDSYFNNAFLGTWTSHKTLKTKPCNWGQYRIPCSGDLDIGAGEFSPNPKYHKNGWEDFMDLE